MTRDEFIQACCSAGYSNKKQSTAWCDTHPKSDYDDSDMIEVYRSVNKYRYGDNHPGWTYLPNGGRTTINNVIRGLAGSNTRDNYW